MTGPLADVDLAILLAFACGSFVAVWSAVVISGFLPRRLGPKAAAKPFGGLLVYGALLLILALVIVLALTVPRLPLAVAIIAAGLAVLGGPFLVEPIPKQVRESTFALIAILIFSAGALIALPRPF